VPYIRRALATSILCAAFGVNASLAADAPPANSVEFLGRQGIPTVRDSAKALTAADPYEEIDWEWRKDYYGRKQETGFHLMMGGLACFVGGVALISIGAQVIESDESEDGSPFAQIPIGVGVLSSLVGFPTLLISGLVMNDSGKAKRLQAERMLNRTGARLDIGPNSLRLSLSF
jgi:hypothetical protein